MVANHMSGEAVVLVVRPRDDEEALVAEPTHLLGVLSPLLTRTRNRQGQRALALHNHPCSRLPHTWRCPTSALRLLLSRYARHVCGSIHDSRRGLSGGWRWSVLSLSLLCLVFSAHSRLSWRLSCGWSRHLNS